MVTTTLSLPQSLLVITHHKIDRIQIMLHIDLDDYQDILADVGPGDEVLDIVLLSVIKLGLDWPVRQFR